MESRVYQGFKGIIVRKEKNREMEKIGMNSYRIWTKESRKQAIAIRPTAINWLRHTILGNPIELRFKLVNRV